MRQPYPNSPAPALSAALGGLPQPGQVGIILARPGVGKSTLLCHLAIGCMLNEDSVMHVAVRDSVEHARAHYDEVLRAVSGSDNRDWTSAVVAAERRRMIHSFAGRTLDLPLLRRNLDMLSEAANFSPDMVVFDGLEAEQLTLALPSLAAFAGALRVPVWVTVRSDSPVPDDCLRHARVVVRLLPANDAMGLASVTAEGEKSLGLLLDPATMLLKVEGEERRPAIRYNAGDCTLYSGGARGTEAAFGAAAAALGVREVNFTFEGHKQERTEGQYVLSPKELEAGDVSLGYVSKRLNRTYNDQGGLIRGVLQTLWHMVIRSQQVFVVGSIQEDGSVRGGTGWSVELARSWSRDLWVFDQNKVGWYRWDGSGWVSGTPTIASVHFTGTGTRSPNADAQAAIADLFKRSFS